MPLGITGSIGGVRMRVRPMFVMSSSWARTTFRSTPWAFPVTLFGSQEPWKVVDYIKGLNWMNYYGGKFSTSGNRGIFMDQALELLPADYWRWYLLANAPESDDSNFTWEHFQTTVNHDLADVLGNFVNRIAKFCTPGLPDWFRTRASTDRSRPKRPVRWNSALLR